MIILSRVAVVLGWSVAAGSRQACPYAAYGVGVATEEVWVRVLDAGISLLEEHGYEGFTIATVCERA